MRGFAAQGFRVWAFGGSGVEGRDFVSGSLRYSDSRALCLLLSNPTRPE